MKCYSLSSITYAIFLTLIVDTAACAGEADWEYGVRANVLVGNGKPANDMLGVGLAGRRFLDNGWFVGGSLDTFSYDFERPAAYLGIARDPAVDVVDADASVTTLGAFFGREYGDANNGFRWFWTLGAGIGLQDIDDVSGPTASGGRFDLGFDAGSDAQLLGTLGTSYFFNSHWSVSFTARAEHHFMDIRIRDRVSGASARIDGQTPIGAYLSLNYRF